MGIYIICLLFLILKNTKTTTNKKQMCCKIILNLFFNVGLLYDKKCIPLIKNISVLKK